MACSHGFTEIVRLLLTDPRVDPKADTHYSLRTASKKGHTDVVKVLLESGRVDPAGSDNYAILKACTGGHTSIVSMLLADSRVDPNCRAHKPLLRASEGGHLDILKMLLSDERVDPWATKDSATCFQRSARAGHLELVKELYTRSKSTHDTLQGIYMGRNALHWAAAEGHFEVAAFLIDQGADLHALTLDNPSGTFIDLAPRNVKIRLLNYVLWPVIRLLWIGSTDEHAPLLSHMPREIIPQIIGAYVLSHVKSFTPPYSSAPISLMKL